jgi:hypothetical protein
MPLLKLNLPQYWVLFLSLIFMLILVIIVEKPMLQFGDGSVIYPLDDAYTRLATAKNLADHGIWGLSPHEFTSASSSILYPILLAVCFKLFGQQLIIPLVINLVAAVGFIVVLQRWLQQQGLPTLHQLLILLAIIYLTPLHIMVANGMEHTLQILLSFLFVMEFCTWFSSEKNTAGNYPAFPLNLYVYALLLTSIRYEGLFLTAVACLALLLRRKWIPASLLGIAALLPVTLFGFYSIAHGAYFIPNSLLVKAVPLPLDGARIGRFFKDDIFNKLLYPYPTKGTVAANRLLIFLPLVCGYFISQLNKNRLYRQVLYFFMAVTFLHLAFADATLFFRYEAYLVACALVVPAVLFAQEGIRLFTVWKAAARCVVAWALVFLLYPFFARSWDAYESAGYGFAHEYQYNYHAARFLHAYYNDATVVMDELGMASWLTTGTKLDPMAGIAFKEVTRANVEGFTRGEYINFLLKKEKPVIALIAENRYHPMLLEGWTKVAAWYTSFRLPGGEAELDLYAVDPTAAPALRASLKAFQSTLPPGITVKFY